MVTLKKKHDKTKIPNGRKPSKFNSDKIKGIKMDFVRAKSLAMISKTYSKSKRSLQSSEKSLMAARLSDDKVSNRPI